MAHDFCCSYLRPSILIAHSKIPCGWSVFLFRCGPTYPIFSMWSREQRIHYFWRLLHPLCLTPLFSSSCITSCFQENLLSKGGGARLVLDWRKYTRELMNSYIVLIFTSQPRMLEWEGNPIICVIPFTFCLLGSVPALLVFTHNLNQMLSRSQW